MALLKGGKKSISGLLQTLVLLMKPHWVHHAVNSLPSSSTLNSVLELSGFLITKIKPKGRKELKSLGRGEKVYLPLHLFE